MGFGLRMGRTVCKGKLHVLQKLSHFPSPSSLTYCSSSQYHPSCQILQRHNQYTYLSLPPQLCILKCTPVLLFQNLQWALTAQALSSAWQTFPSCLLYTSDFKYLNFTLTGLQSTFTDYLLCSSCSANLDYPCPLPKQKMLGFNSPDEINVSFMEFPYQSKTKTVIQLILHFLLLIVYPSTLTTVHLSNQIVGKKAHLKSFFGIQQNNKYSRNIP